MLGLTLEAEAASRLAELSPEAVQYRTFEVVGELIARLADERPVVLAIDDLHWADATSLQLTEQLLGLSDTAAVLIVIKHRTEPDHPSWRVKTIAAEQYPHRSRELALRALSGDAHRELLVSLFGEGTIPQHLEQQILEGAEGNPFYLEELVGTLAETGVLVRDGDGWRFDHEAKIVIPPTVEKVILARIDRLSARDRDVLTAASVLGTPLRAAAARGRDGRGRVAPGVAERAPTRGPDPGGATVARAGVPVQARADPGGRVQDAARRRPRGAPPQGDALARGALRREPRRGARPARVPRAGRERRGRGGPLPDARRRPRPPRMGARRGDRPLPRAASAARAPWRRPGDRARPPEARDRAPHLAAFRRGERDVPEGLPVLEAADSRDADRDPAHERQLRAASLRPARRGLLARHQPVHAALRPARRGVAGPDDHPVASRALGDLGRRAPLRLPPAGRAALVGWDALDRTRLGVRHPADARPRAARNLRADLLRARERRGVLPRPQRRCRGDRRAGARRPDRRVQARRACPVLHERRQPSGFGAGSASRNRARRRRLDGSRATGRQRPVPAARARRRATRPRAQRVLCGRPPGERRPRRDHSRYCGRGSRRRSSAASSTSSA